MQPNSEYVEAVNFHLAKLDESRVTYRLWQLWTYQPMEEFGFEEAVSLGYDNIIFPVLWYPWWSSDFPTGEIEFSTLWQEETR